MKKKLDSKHFKHFKHSGQKKIKCKACKGSGKSSKGYPCTPCRGLGVTNANIRNGFVGEKCVNADREILLRSMGSIKR